MLKVGRTRGQCAVLLLVVAGLTNREIADLLEFCTQTADMHLSHFLERLGCRCGVDAVRKAGERGLLND